MDISLMFSPRVPPLYEIAPIIQGEAWVERRQASLPLALSGNNRGHRRAASSIWADRTGGLLKNRGTALESNPMQLTTREKMSGQDTASKAGLPRRNPNQN